MQSLCAYTAVALVTGTSVSAYFDEATGCGDNSVVQLNRYGRACYYHDPTPTASLPPTCSGSLAEFLRIHLAASSTAPSIRIYNVSTHDAIEPSTIHQNVFTDPVVACMTGALADRFITKCWVAQPGEKVCIGANDACGLLHSHGDAVFRDVCAGDKPPYLFEWPVALPWQMNGWVV